MHCFFMESPYSPQEGATVSPLLWTRCGSELLEICRQSLSAVVDPGAQQVATPDVTTPSLASVDGGTRHSENESGRAGLE